MLLYELKALGWVVNLQDGNKKGRDSWQLGEAIFWPTSGFKTRTFDSFVFSAWGNWSAVPQCGRAKVRIGGRSNQGFKALTFVGSRFSEEGIYFIANFRDTPLQDSGHRKDFDLACVCVQAFVLLLFLFCFVGFFEFFICLFVWLVGCFFCCCFVLLLFCFW